MHSQLFSAVYLFKTDTSHLERSRKFAIVLLLFTLLVPSYTAAKTSSNGDKTVHIELQEATSTQGYITTQSGGVVWSEGFRIQATNIQVHKAKHKTFIKAWGNLLLFYHDKLIRGDYLFFDVEKKTGKVENALMGVGRAYVGAKQLKLTPKGSLSARNVWISPYPTPRSLLALESQKILLNRQKEILAKRINFRFFRLPIFYLPAHQVSLNNLFEDQFELRAQLRSLHKSKAFVRWKFYTHQQFQAHLLASYYWGRGVGIGLEIKHHDAFQLRTQLIKDSPTHTPYKTNRWRCKGAYEKIFNPQSTLTIAVDALSDYKFTQNYNFDSFDQQNHSRTFLHWDYRASNSLWLLQVEEKLNSFQTVKRRLPSLYLSTHPYQTSFLNHIPVTLSSTHETAQLAYDFSALSYENPYQNMRHISCFQATTHAKYKQCTLSTSALIQLQARSHTRQNHALEHTTLESDNIKKHWANYQVILNAQRMIPLSLPFRFSPTPRKGLPLKTPSIIPTAPSHGLLILCSELTLQGSSQISPDHHYLFDSQDCASHLQWLKAKAHYRYYHCKGKNTQFLWEVAAPWKKSEVSNRYQMKQRIGFQQMFLSTEISSSTHISLLAKSALNFNPLEKASLSFSHTFSKMFAAQCQYQYFSSTYYKSWSEDNSLLKEYREETQLSALSGQKQQVMASLVCNPNHFTSYRTDHVRGFHLGLNQGYYKHGISVATTIGKQWILRACLFTDNEGLGFKIDLKLSSEPPVAASSLP